MDMTPEEIAAVGVLMANSEWGIYLDYIEKLLNFERDKCVVVKQESVAIHQGRARAFREVLEIQLKAEKLYSNR
jgi:hypothetical protein